MKKPLKSLIYPYSKSEFFDHYEENTPLVVHDLGESIRELTELPFLESLETLLASWPNKVDAYLPGIADEANSIEIPTEEALKHFGNGMGLLFNDINIISSVLEKWLEALKYELGLSSLTYARNLVYAIPAGKGTAPHFDQNINFVLQIHGTKKWRVAPNQHVESPMSRHTIGLPIDPELGSYTESRPTVIGAGFGLQASPSSVGSRATTGSRVPGAWTSTSTSSTMGGLSASAGKLPRPSVPSQKLAATRTPPTPH